jgi:hypothetical protein
MPDGYFKVFDQNKFLLFKGKLKDYKIPKNKGTHYCLSGSSLCKTKYILKTDGLYCIKQKNNETICCYLDNDKLSGEGILYTNNGLCSQKIECKNDQIIKKGSCINHEDLLTIDSNFVEQMKQEHKGLLAQILKYPPKLGINENLTWIKKYMQKDIIYVGECINQKIPHGRGSFIYPSGDMYIGYVMNGEKHGQGKIYSTDKVLLFKGNFYHNKKEGFGYAKLEDGSTYYGNFHNDDSFGLGVLYEEKNSLSRKEGFFSKNFTPEISYLVSVEDSTIQRLIFNPETGNFIISGDLIQCKESEFMLKNLNTFDELIKDYPKQVKEIKSMKKVSDSDVLLFGIKYTKDGIYIGDMNQIRFMHGRGILMNQLTGEAIVGYFSNNKVKDHKTTKY